MKTTILTAIAILGLAAAPAFAGEGNGDPFPNRQVATTRILRPAFSADVGSNQFPSIAGRPGSNLPLLAGAVLPSEGSEAPVQTANSLPRGFEEGTVAYAQARSINAWQVAHGAASTAAFANR